MVLLLELEDDKGSWSDEGDAELWFIHVECEMEIGHLLEISSMSN